ncbi:MAG TPA: Rieske 2Fe-2S domain-containing protein [Pirellulales bacterium]|jgi:menaquinol-cytochrome c reductase iron-sulfur subunit
MSIPSRPTPAAAKPPASSPTERRGFFTKFAAVVTGALLFVCPALAGVAVVLDPLRRKSGRGEMLKITTLDALPENGEPRRFPVVADRQDAWTRFPAEPIGAVFLRRTGPKTVEALSACCPHLGCFVDFKPQREEYQCPCHTSAFSVDGAFISGPSPRGLDTLECVVKSEGDQEEVWVKFENFYTGREEKTPKA